MLDWAAELCQNGSAAVPGVTLQHMFLANRLSCFGKVKVPEAQRYIHVTQGVNPWHAY